VDALYEESTGKAGRATHFLSWVWSYKVKLFQATLQAWLESDPTRDPDEIFLWICFFCNNQYRLEETNADDLETVFKGRLSELRDSGGSMIAMLDTWRQPVYLTRIWCVYEQVYRLQ